MKWKRSASCLVLGLVAGAGGMYALGSLTDYAPLSSQDCRKTYPFTSRALDCENLEENVATLKELDQRLRDAAAAYVRSGKATRVSVWVRDLERKQWAAANETTAYAPASLLKVPIMIAYYKYAEVETNLLQQTLLYPEVIDVPDQHFKADVKPLVVGKSYTIDELIRRMIVHSDNVATALLLRSLDQAFYQKTLIDIGIRIPARGEILDFVTAKTYANVYRILYNASYLNREYSEKALQLLSEVKFLGARTALPESVVLAHKFGERSYVLADGTNAVELHDCGIVYRDDYPFSLCIMTSGTDFEALLTVIEEIAKMTYDHLK